MNFPWTRNDPFGRRKAGFPQEERLRKTDFSLHLKGRYTWQGEERDSWINVINPRRGILILGSPGSGKSWFIIEPMIRQLMEKGFAMFIYDFKYNTLTRKAYSLFLANRDKYPVATRFYSINFTDLTHSHRCNILEPSTLEWMSDAVAASRTILLSMNKSWLHRQGDFFVESPINFLAALIWYLRQYKEGIYCTLPHVIELAQTPYDQLFELLSHDPQTQTLLNPFQEAFDHKAMEMLEGQIASAKIPLGRLASPEVYYILTGNDVTLDINNPAAPKILCIGGDATKQEALGPVISLYIDRLNRIVNRPGKYPCAIVCDEFATVRAYSMMDTVATGRSNNIIPILALQDLSQLRTQYSKAEADQILNVPGNILCGQVGGETARWLNDRFPRIQEERTTVSLNSTDTSVSKSLQWEPTVIPATISALSSGEFLGIVADDPDQKIELKAFHARLTSPVIDTGDPIPLPYIRSIAPDEVIANFRRIRQDISDMLFAAKDPVGGGAPALEDFDF